MWERETWEELKGYMSLPPLTELLSFSFSATIDYDPLKL